MLEVIIKENPNYTINELGIVKSIKGKVIKPRLVSNYLVVFLGREGNRKTKKYRVHRLVANAFIPNPENKIEVNHKDRNRFNNVLSNLEWNTTEENNEHYINSYIKEGEEKSMERFKQIILNLPEDYPIRDLLNLL